MKQLLLILSILFASLTTSASTGAVRVVVDSLSSDVQLQTSDGEAISNNVIAFPDSLMLSDTDTINDIEDTLCVDSTLVNLPLKKRSWFKRALSFFDRVLSPPRDPEYIEVQDWYNWCGEIQLTTRFEIYQMESGDDLNMKVSPKWRTRIGPFFGWRWAFLGYNIDLKSIFMNSDDTDLSGSIYSAAFGLDLFYRRVGGNYNINRLRYNGIDYSDYMHGEPFDGINIGMSRISFYYIFNYNHYSHQAAFSQTNRQLRSAGSPIAGISYAHNRMSMDWNSLSQRILTINKLEKGVVPLFEEQKNNEISLMGGYAYNWVFHRNWLAGAELTGSIGYLIHHSSVMENKREEQKHETFFDKIGDFQRKNLAFNGNFRFALLYNNGPWFAGTQAVVFYYQYGNANVQTRNILGSMYLFVGFNF